MHKHASKSDNFSSGFTLIEAILICMVVITLALIIFPNFSKSKKVAMKKEAISSMKLIAAAERIYRIENEFYAPCNGAGCNSMLSLMLNTTNWNYSVDATANPGSTTLAIGADSNSLLPGCSYSIDQNGLDGEPVPSGC